MRTADYSNSDDETEKEVTTGDEEFGESDGTGSYGTGSERYWPQSASKHNVESETTKRMERRERRNFRENSMRKREKEGKKAFYLLVNYRGIPYGDGLGAWKSDLNKLARALDPSVMDIKQQPPAELATLRRRLRQNFEYSAPVDPLYIRRLVGTALAQYRCKLMKMVGAG